MAKYIRPDGIMDARFIKPGQGSSAYYERGQLERDAPLFKGAHVYINHPSRQEDRDMPERSLLTLAGEITETPVFKPQGLKGPGLYGPVRILPHWRGFVEEIASLSGMSLRATGVKILKNKGGQKVYVAEKFNPGLTVDFVTKAGAGGAALPLIESALKEADQQIKEWEKNTDFRESDDRSEETRFAEWSLGKKQKPPIEGGTMDLQEAQRKLAESVTTVDTLTKEKETLVTENTKLMEAIALRDARDKATEALNDPKNVLPDVTKARLIEALTKAAPMKDSKLDEGSFARAIEEAVRDELKYVKDILAKKPGITGLGTTPDDNGQGRLKEVLKTTYQDLGMSKEEAEQMAEVAAKGR